MKHPLFTKKNFRSWLKKQAETNRLFNNCNGSTCVGHRFVTESNFSHLDWHPLITIIDLSGGWFEKFWDIGNVERVTCAKALYRSFCRWTKKS